MRHPLSAADIERFQTVIARRLGLQFEEARLEFLADVMRRRLELRGHAAQVYLARLETGYVDDEVGALAQELTVPETYFFRHHDQYRAFSEIALPNRMGAQCACRRVRILSAGCASGEEAYSLAMLVREAHIDRSWDISILGVDVNPAIVRKTKLGLYSK